MLLHVVNGRQLPDVLLWLHADFLNTYTEGRQTSPLFCTMQAIFAICHKNCTDEIESNGERRKLSESVTMAVL